MSDEVQTKRELTDAFLKTLTVDGRMDYSDTNIVGFQLRVSKAGDRSFSVRSRGHDGDLVRVSIGAYPGMSLKSAREAARVMIGRIKAGEDVNGVKRLARSEKPRFPTLMQILDEYQQSPRGLSTGIWQKSKTGMEAQAPRTILSVLGSLADRDVTGISLAEVAAALQGHRRIGRTGTAETASGQSAHARAYLKTPFDWSSGRGAFRKIGSGRLPAVATPDIAMVADPSDDDHTITGIRARALSGEEIQAIMPWLTYPARHELGMRLSPEKDFRPIFLRFILLTAPRKGEVESMRWHDVDMKNGVWIKPDVKNTRGHGGPARVHIVHLSDAALDLLKGLPGSDQKIKDAFVFPNGIGDMLGNWPRIMRAIERKSETSGWHRHDLRRTSGTLLDMLGIDANLIARVLGHSSTKRDSQATTALRHYVVKSQMIPGVVNPMKIALDSMAILLDWIVTGELDMPDVTTATFDDETD